MVLDLCTPRRISVGAMSWHGGSSDPQGQGRPKAQARGALRPAACGPAVHTHLLQGRAATKVTGASDPQLPADPQSECKRKPTVYTQATIPCRVPWASPMGLGDMEEETNTHLSPTSEPALSAPIVGAGARAGCVCVGGCALSLFPSSRGQPWAATRWAPLTPGTWASGWWMGQVSGPEQGPRDLALLGE